MTDNEKTVLGKLIDELRAELSTTQLNCDMWHDRAEDMRNRLSVAQTENAKLRNEIDNLMDFEHLTSVAVAYAGCDECGEYKQTMLRLFAENAKLRDSLKALMMGTNVELCADRDASRCQECFMAYDEHRCAMSDAILLLGIDMYGEPLGGEPRELGIEVGQ